MFYGDAYTLPEVVVTVSNGSITLSSGLTTYYHTFDSSSVYGYKLSADADTYIGIGETYIFYPDYASSTYGQVLHPVYRAGAVHTTTVYLYDDSGKLLLYKAFPGEGASPTIPLSVYDHSVIIGSEDDSVQHAVLRRKVKGLSTAPGDSVLFSPGSTYYLSGQDEKSTVYTLYLITDFSDSGVDDGSGSVATTIIGSFVSSLITPVMAFFTVEFIPGFSFGRIALFSFVVGLVFWFLKISRS